MAFADDQLAGDRPSAIHPVALPRREAFFPSPADWRDEVIYFLLPDRFSDGREDTRPLLRSRESAGASPGRVSLGPMGAVGRRTLAGRHHQGIASKLPYLQQLGVSTVWLGPVFKQRGPDDSYHGYAIQDFLDVDPRLGTRARSRRPGPRRAHGRPPRHPRRDLQSHRQQLGLRGRCRTSRPSAWPQFYRRGRWRTGADGLADADRWTRRRRVAVGVAAGDALHARGRGQPCRRQPGRSARRIPAHRFRRPARRELRRAARRSTISRAASSTGSR